MAAGRIVLSQYFPARDRNGAVVPGALLTVLVNLSSSVKASIYAEEALTTPLANPVEANSSGQFPAIWAEGGTTVAPVLFTLSITGPDGESIGNPSVFDNYSVSVDADTASVALAEAAATAAEEAYADVLAVVATGSDAAAIAARAAKAANGSDFADIPTVRTNLGVPSLVALAAATGTGLLGWLQAGTGAILRTLLSKLFEMPVTPEDFGAVGDGTTNDAVALGRALTHACTTGKRFMGGAGKTYRVATEISINRSGMPEVVIDGNGSRVIADEAGIIFTGDAHFLTTTLTADPVRGAAKITLASVAGIVQGDMIEILNPAYVFGTANARHYYLVSELDGNDVYIEGSVVNDINAAQITASGATGSISVKVYHLCKQITVQNWNFTARAATAVTASLQVSNNYRAVINNLKFDGHCRVQLLSQYNGHDLVTGVHVRDFGYINKNIGYANLPAGADVIGNPIANSPDGLSYGYGMIHQCNYSSQVTDCSAGHGWHACDAATGQMHITYTRVKTGRNGYGLNCHEGVWNATYLNCELRGLQGLNVGRAIRAVIRDCEFIDTRNQCIAYGNFMSELTIEGCTFDVQNATDLSLYAVYKDTTAGSPGAGAVSTGYDRLFVFKGNTVKGLVGVNAGFTGTGIAGDMIVADNDYLRASVDCSVLNNTIIHDQRFALVQGQFAVQVNQIDATTKLSIKNITEIDSFSIPAGACLIRLVGVTPASLRIKSCETSGTLVRIDGAITINEVSGCTVSGFLATGDNTQTVKNSVNNLSGAAYYQVAVTTSVNNTTMTA